MKKKMMLLSEFYKKNRITPKGRVYKLHDQLLNGMLNRLQRVSVVHGLDLHAATPAWKTVWKHIEDRDGKMVKAYRDPAYETTRSDLPPIAIQWKQAYRHGGKTNG